MSSLTTLFVVGPEEYVEFNESLGSKAFLEHVWDQSTTPLRDGETADSRLRSAGARISQTPPPRIEFPTILRIKGSGNKYKPSGKWISWDELRRQNPLAVSAPPSLEEFQKRGGKVGSGEKLKAGEWLTEESIGIKKAKQAAQGGDSRIAKGASESVYAPKDASSESQETADWASLGLDRDGSRTPLGSELDICSVNTTPQCKTDRPPETPMMQPPTPKLGQEPRPRKSTRSLFERFVSDELSPEMPSANLPSFSAEIERAQKQDPHSPPTAPSSSRTAAPPQPEILSTPAREPVNLPLVSPSTARTPLSATHPLPETPLKVPHPPRAPLAERRSRPSVAPITPASHDTSEERAPRGLGLGLTPTRPNMFGGPLSPVQFRAPPSSRSRPLEATLTEAAEHQEDLEEDDQASSSRVAHTDDAPSQRPSFSSDSSSGGPRLRGGKATDEIEAMLQRLRTARTGLGNSGGTNASRWASQDPAESTEAGASAGRKPPALLARLSAAPSVASADDKKMADKGVAKQDQAAEPNARHDTNAATTSTAPSEERPGGKKKLTVKERREKAKEKKRQAAALAKSAETSSSKRSEAASSSIDTSTADSRSAPSKQPQSSAFKEEFSVGSTVHNIAAAPSMARGPSASSSASTASAMSRIPSGPSAAANTAILPPTEPKAMRKSSASRAAAPKAVPPQKASPVIAAPPSPPEAAPRTDPEPATHVASQDPLAASQSPVEPEPASSETPQAAAPETPSSSAHSRQSSTTHVDWADDEDDEDALPDLEDWGITIPPSESSASIVGAKPAASATPPTGPKSGQSLPSSSSTASQLDNKAQPDSSALNAQRNVPPTGPRGLRIAGRASSNPQAESGPGGLRIAGVASQTAGPNASSQGQQPMKRRELIPGTVNSMHAPPADEEVDFADTVHTAGRKGRRGGAAPRQNGTAHPHPNGRGVPPHLQQHSPAAPSEPAQQPQARRTELKERPRPKLTGDGAFARLAMGIVGVKNAAVGAASGKEAKAAAPDTRNGTAAQQPPSQPAKHAESGPSGASKHGGGGRGGRAGRGGARGGRGGGRRAS